MEEQKKPSEKKQKLQPRFLVFGADGWIGNKMADLVCAKYKCVGTTTARMENRESVMEELNNHKPTHVLLCAGITGRPTVDWCEDHKQTTIRSNVIGTLNVIDCCYTKQIHVTNFATGCIYQYDDEHPIDGTPFTEEDTPNFTGSFYSKTKALVESLLCEYNNCLTLRIRMPIASDLTPRNFVTKILHYEKVVNIPNSMTVLDTLLPIALQLAEQSHVGTINFCNPGTIAHNDILQMYKDIIDPSFTWSNFSEEECNAILKAPRSNNMLDTSKLQNLFPDIPPIMEACRDAFVKMAAEIAQCGKDQLVEEGWKFPFTKTY